MATNPVNIPITGDSTGHITCNSYAQYYQRVTLQWSGFTLIFSGSGEGVAMKTGGGSSVYNIPPSPQGFSISALFEFSLSGPGGPFRLAEVQDPIISQNGLTTFVTVTSEDGGDTDYNDSYLIIVYSGFRKGS